MRKELKPCPFCGAEAGVEYAGANQWVCGCGNDDCRVVAEVYASNKRDAIDNWNRRVE